MRKSKNVKACTVEVILAGDVSYHSDLVKALQQRGRQESRALLLVALVFYSTILLTEWLCVHQHF